jgi:hypothetical protein
MSKSEKVEIFLCPDCDAEIPSWTTCCWCCERNFPNGPQASGVIRITKEELDAKRKSTQVDLSSAAVLLLVVPLLIVVSVIALAPGMGILLLIFSVPALAHINYSFFKKDIPRKHARQRNLAVTILAWFGLIAILGASLAVTFFLYCAASLPGSSHSEKPSWDFKTIVLLSVGGAIALIISSIVMAIKKK